MVGPLLKTPKTGSRSNTETKMENAKDSATSLSEREERIRRNCELVLNSVRHNPTDRIKMFMKSFMNMRLLLEREYAELLAQNGKSESEIILILDKSNGRAKWMAQMECMMEQHEISTNIDDKNSYLDRISNNA